MKNPLYFAYGSNMHPEQMKHRCPAAIKLGVGRLRDWEFLINDRGVATINKREGARVLGVVYEVTRLCVAYLDVYEGVASGRYGKFCLPIEIRDSRGLWTCLTYVDPTTEPGYPRKGYLEKVVDGAVRNGLPRVYVRELKHWRHGYGNEN